MIEGKVIISKVWRSELVRVTLFIILVFASPILSAALPGSVIKGPLFSTSQSTFFLSFPLFWLLPFFSFVDAAFRIYNVRYVVDSQGIEAWEGILSLRQSITHVRHEDIRSIETDQGVLERVLDVGEISISTAATGGVEVQFKGVSKPKQVQNWLQAERDEVTKRSGRRAPIEQRSEIVVEKLEDSVAASPAQRRSRMIDTGASEKV